MLLLLLLTNASLIWSSQMQPGCYLNTEYLEKIDRFKSPMDAYSNNSRGSAPDLGIPKDFVFISHFSRSSLRSSKIQAWLNFQYAFSATIHGNSFQADEDKSYHPKISQDSLLRIGGTAFSPIGPSRLCEEENLEAWIFRRIFEGAQYTSKSNKSFQSRNGITRGVIDLNRLVVVAAPKPGQNFSLFCGSKKAEVSCYAFEFSGNTLNIFNTDLVEGWYVQKGLLFSGKTSDSTLHEPKSTQ